MEKPNILALSPQELRQFLVELGEKPYRAGQILGWLYHKGAQSWGEMTDLPKALRDKLAALAEIGLLPLVKKQLSADGTGKYLSALADGQTVETVLLPYDIGSGACISTQVGCKMGCRFCASGLPGFIRNLSAAEIMAQVLLVKGELGKRGLKLKRLVLMGTGEPLDNYDSIMAFLEAVQDRERLGMSLRHVTLSTAGLVPRIYDLAGFGRPLNLAVSLNAPNNALRDRLMPINRAYPLERLLPACDHYAKKTGRRVTYEYILIEGVNDRPAHAAQLAALLKGRLAHVNLIPFNAVPELDFKPSPADVVREFARTLADQHINVTVRRRLGADIAAACGQLRNSNLKTPG
ncbi:MAG TPA: 23S rRNA (adenine(2503)-C(2))-methyltransferase RlmN [Bacillota bacterium]|nr:23S rRNA (adenine(2503)-C(2))-methyltransferase RlmN [Bacillota bacterium]